MSSFYRVAFGVCLLGSSGCSTALEATSAPVRSAPLVTLDAARADHDSGQCVVTGPARVVEGRTDAVDGVDVAALKRELAVRSDSGSALPTPWARIRSLASTAGVSAVWPSLAPMTDGRALLVWTEISGEKHDVRAQVIDCDGALSGPRMTIAADGANDLDVLGHASASFDANGRGQIAFIIEGGTASAWRRRRSPARQPSSPLSSPRARSRMACVFAEP